MMAFNTTTLTHRQVGVKGEGGGRRRRGRMRLMVRLMVKVGDGVKKDDGEA